MSATSSSSSNTSFFCFGVEDSFISKSFEGLRYRNLPASLHDLIIGGSVRDVHWAALGPVRESWVLSFVDASGKHNLGWGEHTANGLESILKRATPSPHLRVFLGPTKDLDPFDKVSKVRAAGSFIVWDASFIRWGNLPFLAEEQLQTWLSPSGWKDGPPRIATWGPSDAFFMLSEYGKAAHWTPTYRNTWPILQETFDEWEADKGFEWSELAYISLDPTTLDQFIAIRNDGTWAGSIDDTNEEALEAFALNFFRPHSKPRSKSQQQQSKPNSNQQHHHHNHQNTNGHTPNGFQPRKTDTVPSAAAQALYEKWATETATLLASALAANSTTNNTSSSTPRTRPPPRKLQIRSQSSTSTLPTSPSPAVPNPKLLTTFPYLPAALATCALPLCLPLKADVDGLRACKHDVERLLRASGLYSKEWLRQERIRWHPDRFGRLCAEEWRERGRRLAEEMFKIVDGLVGEVERGEGGDGRDG